MEFLDLGILLGVSVQRKKCHDLGVEGGLWRRNSDVYQLQPLSSLPFVVCVFQLKAWAKLALEGTSSLCPRELILRFPVRLPGARDPGNNNSKSLSTGNSKSDGEVCTSFPRLWLTKYHKQGDFDNRNFLPPSSAGWNTEIEVPAELVPPEGWERFPGGTSDKEPPPPNAGDLSSVPGSGQCPGGQHSKSLQYSCLENPMDRGA